MASLCPNYQKDSVRITADKPNRQGWALLSTAFIFRGCSQLVFLPSLGHPLCSMTAAYSFRDIFFCLLLMEKFWIQNNVLRCVQGSQISMGRVTLVGMLQQPHLCKDRCIDTACAMLTLLHLC